MSYKDVFDKRMLQYGNDEIDYQIKTSQQATINIFKTNPSYKQITINSSQVDSIINKGKTSKLKKAIFLPDVVFEIGSLVEIETNKYLITDFQTDSLSPTAELELCNNTLWITPPPHKEWDGQTVDKFGTPVYTEVQSNPIPFPCIVDKITDLYESAVSQAISFSDGRIALTIGNTDDPNLVVGKTFNMFDKTYQIYGIDRSKTINNNEGLLVILANDIATEAS